MSKINDSTIIYSATPATHAWRDASLVGSGHVWAAVLGAYSNEELQICRDDLGAGGYTGVLQDVSDKFPAVRRAYSDGKIMDAEKLLSSEFAKKGYKPLPERSIPVATVAMNFDINGFVTNYERTTDMSTGEAEVSFRAGSTAHTRRVFAARGTDIVAYSVDNRTNLTLGVKIPAGANIQNHVLTYEGEYILFAARTGGVDYGFVGRILAPNAQITPDPIGISIKNAENLTIFIKTFNESNRDTEFKKLRAELGALKSYDKLFASHDGAHKRLFESSTLTLEGAGSRKDDIAALLASATAGELSPDLVARLWNFGKYLAIIGVRAQGVTLFNAAELLYCGSMCGILPDIVLSYFEMFEKYVDDLRKNAARVYGMRGYFVPSVISPKSALFGSVDAGTIHFISSAALAANIFYRHYLLTGDVKILKSRIFPFMCEILNFYSDYLKLDQMKFYTTVPSYSPMATPGNIIAGKRLENFAFCTNATIDFLAIGALLDNLIEAAGICGSKDGVAMWQDMKTKIPPFGLTKEGTLREYTNSAFIDGPVNLGTMHAYGLWPIKSISFNDKNVTYQPAVAAGAPQREIPTTLREASFKAMAARFDASGTKQDARSIAVCALQAAHAGLGNTSSDKLHEILLKLLASCFTAGGLCVETDWRGSGFTRNGGGDIDVCGNIGFANAISECIVQSNQRTLRILPCVFDAIGAGSVTDVVTDFAAKVSVDWNIKKGVCVVKITPKFACKIDIIVNGNFRKIKSKEIKMNSEINGLKDFPLVAGRTTVLEFA